MGPPGWQRFLSGYYVANTLLLASYAIVRLYFFEHGPDPKFSKLASIGALLSKERQAFPVLFAALAIKFWRQQSLDQFFSEAFLYTKAAVGIMLFYVDFRLLVAFLMIWLLLFLLVAQPIYNGPTLVKTFTPVTFKEKVLDRPETNIDWLVELFAPWSPACVHLEPVLAELSLALSTDNLKFCKVDVGKWPALAEQFKVSLSGASQQLPTLIMFENGKEVARIPHLYPDGNVAKGRFRKGDIITCFDLEKRSNKRQEDRPESSRAPRRRR